MSEDLDRGDVVTARFEPQRDVPLKPRAEPLVGYRGEWEVLWEIEEGYHYAGQWACHIPREWGEEHRPDFVWVPSGDLVIEAVDPSGRW